MGDNDVCKIFWGGNYHNLIANEVEARRQLVPGPPSQNPLKCGV